jgi:hypothetical protein
MLRMIAESSHLLIIPPEGYDKRISFHDPRIEQEASRMRRIGIRYVPSANGTRSTRALSGNIGSFPPGRLPQRADIARGARNGDAHLRFLCVSAS